MGQPTITQATAITMEYSSWFDEEELAEVRTALREFGPVRMTDLQMPQAGAETLLLAIYFVGSSALQGLIGDFATSLFRRLVEKLKSLGKHRSLPLPSRIDQVMVSFDDLDVYVGLPHPEGIAKLPQILAEVHHTIIVSPPCTDPIHRVFLPMAEVDGRWMWWSTNVSGSREYPFRYWLLEARGISAPPRLYDTFDNHLFVLHSDEALWRYTNLQTPPTYVLDPIEKTIARLRPHLPYVAVQRYAQRVHRLASALLIQWPQDPAQMDETIDRLLSLCESAERGNALVLASPPSR